MSERRDLWFVGDVHLDAGEPALPDFLAFLASLSTRASRLVLLGDLFNLWVGSPELERDHHREVAAVLANLRRAGVGVRYVEGNRDYRVGDRYTGGALDDATDGALEERQGGRRFLAVHGDLANRADRQYRAWRRLSRSAAFWRAFRVLPPAVRIRLAEGLERRMRGTNPAFRRAFPEAAVRGYAAGFFARGVDVVVLGHFHVERDLTAVPPSPPGRILVLPEWKESRRALRAGPDGDLELVATG